MSPATQVDLDAVSLTETERFDAQYGSTEIFTGVPLEVLIGRIQAPAQADLALLHFGNGVVVPLRYRDPAVMKRLQPWVARGMHLTDSGMTTGRFKPITNRLRAYFDVPVIKFAGNKLVVAERWHPDVPARAQKDLSPWVHVDSLVAIELVNGAAYHSMFDVQAKTAPGLALFHQSCQFCHGVRQVGAKFGMDFVEPVPVHKWKDLDRRFYWHVKYRRRDPVLRGEMMPALSFSLQVNACGDHLRAGDRVRPIDEMGHLRSRFDFELDPLLGTAPAAMVEGLLCRNRLRSLSREQQRDERQRRCVLDDLQGAHLRGVCHEPERPVERNLLTSAGLGARALVNLTVARLHWCQNGNHPPG
jgi:hypothetical protein